MAGPPLSFDRELADLPPDLRWREWMARIEAVIFASPEPVSREQLAALVGAGCVIDELIADIRRELRERPFDLVEVARGFQHRTRPRFGEVIRLALGRPEIRDLSPTEQLVLTAIAYFQPITRDAVAAMIGRNVGRDLVARLRQEGLVAPGPRAPQPGAPVAYVTTPLFLERLGLSGLSELPDMDDLRELGSLEAVLRERALRAADGPPESGETSAG